jgi:hypothetical protein
MPELSPMQALIQRSLALKIAERDAAIFAVVELSDPQWREVVRWGIEEYERQLQIQTDARDERYFIGPAPAPRRPE